MPISWPPSPDVAPEVSSRKYATIGNGIADDTAALQAAINNIGLYLSSL